MINNIVKAFVEGRGSMASLERAIEQSANPLQTRGDVQKEMAAELALTNLFTSIPPPSIGLAGVMAALKKAPAPELHPRKSENMKNVSDPLRESMKGIPEPVGGYSAAISRLKAKLAATPLPELERGHVNELEDIRLPGLDDMPAASSTATTERKKGKRATSKIVRMPQNRSTQWRDVLAAGKDLPENPDEIPE